MLNIAQRHCSTIDYTRTIPYSLLLLVLICQGLGNMSQPLSWDDGDSSSLMSVSLSTPARPNRRSLSSGPSRVSTPLSPSYTPSTTDDEGIKQNPRSAVWKYFKLKMLPAEVSGARANRGTAEQLLEYSVCMVSAATNTGYCGWKRQG